MGQSPRRRHRRRPFDSAQDDGRVEGRRSDPFWDLVATAKRLQAPGGCPWDRAQTIPSLLPHLIEETWEVFEAVRTHHNDELQGELGDVLYCVLFLTLIAERSGWTTLEALLTATREKMVRRHPHVFGEQRVRRPHEAYRHWQASKRLEGARRHSPSDAFRKQLVAQWERLRTSAGTPPRGRRDGQAASGRRSTQSRAKRARVRGQSPSRARGQPRVD